jgi:hypothetical protein
VDLLQFLLDKNNIFIVAVAVVSGVMLAIPALRKGRTGSAVSTGEAIQMVNQRQAVWVDVRPAEQFLGGRQPAGDPEGLNFGGLAPICLFLYPQERP